MKNGYYISPLDDKSLEDVSRRSTEMENKMTFYFLNFNKNITMTEKDEEDFRKNIDCRFCEKKSS